MPVMLSAAPMASVFCATLLRLMSASFETGSGHICTPSAGVTGLDRIGVVDTGRPAAQQAEVAVHGVLVQRDQQIQPIPHVGDFLRSGPDSKKSVPAADDGLVRVVHIEVQAAAAEYLCEDVTWGGNALTGRASNTNSEGLPHAFFSRPI